jgi:hypothetical protein
MGMQPIRARVRPTVTALQPADRRYATSGVGDALAGAAGQMLQDQQQRQQVRDTVDDIDARIAERERQQRRQVSFTDGFARYAQEQADMRVWLANNPPDVAGKDYAVKVQEYVQGRMANFRASLDPDEEVQLRFGLITRQFESEQIANAQIIEGKARSQAQADNYAVWRETQSNNIYETMSDETARQALVQSGQILAALEGVDGNTKAKLAREDAQAFTRALITGLSDKGQHEKAGALLDSGLVNGVFDDEQMKQLRRQVGLSRERAELEAERAQREAEAGLKEEYDGIVQRAEDGVASPAQLQRAAAIAKQIGTDSDQYEIEKLTIVNQTAASLQGASIRQIDTAISTVQARIARAGDKATVTDRLSLQKMQDIRKDRVTEQGARYKAMLAEGPQGVLAVLRELDGYDRETRFQIANEAQDGLGIVSLLGAKMRGLAVEGRAMPETRKELAPDEKVKPAMKKFLGRVRRELGPEYDAYLDVAADIYTAASASRGRAAFDEKAFGHYVNQVFGATQRPNGVMQGGIGTYLEEKVQLPDDYTESEFIRSIHRYDFAPARNPRGGKIPKDFITQHTIPEYVRDDPDGRPVYQFRDRQGELILREGGGPMLVKIPPKVRR